MTDIEVVTIPPILFPRRLYLNNYIELFKTAPTLRWFFNSVYISAATTLLVVIISTLAGYSFAKKKFPGGNIIFYTMVLGIMIPKQILVVPLFKIVHELDMFNKPSGLIIPALGFPFGVFLMKQFIVTLPSEIIEASTIDGCGELGTFIRIVMPISKPGLGALAIFTFIQSWNDYMWQLLVISSRDLKTLPLGIATFQEEFSMRYGLLLAGGVLASLPMIVIFLIFQKYFTKGIVMGAVKG
ncbi:MAG TPA: carbohydrate ABC transporter permease [Clostridiaceae bacterium]|nr:carbohydrate ABC transporter permease [Clostridiaceae bacterium]